ncbi:MAG: BACON domain-containing protein [Prevotella copri]|nr:BACON domain-containing protein [Segatella copri]MDY6204516.1 BACON domain-containing protein [Segatella copri]
MKKKQLSIYSLALASLLLLPLGSLTSCSDKEETDVFASEELSLTMSLTPTVVDLPAKGGSQVITITSNTAWGASANVTWANLSATNGVANSTLTVTLEDNNTTSPREAIVTFTYGKDQQTVTINQAAASPTTFAKVQASNIGRYQADVSGMFTSDFNITEYGIVYSLTEREPTTSMSDDKVTVLKVGTTATTQDIVSATLTNLRAGNTYFARLYTKGPLGTEYSNVISFTTSGGAPDSGDNPTPGY